MGGGISKKLASYHSQSGNESTAGSVSEVRTPLQVSSSHGLVTILHVIFWTIYHPLSLILPLANCYEEKIKRICSNKMETKSWSKWCVFQCRGSYSCLEFLRFPFGSSRFWNSIDCSDPPSQTFLQFQSVGFNIFELAKFSRNLLCTEHRIRWSIFLFHFLIFLLDSSKYSGCWRLYTMFIWWKWGSRQSTLRSCHGWGKQPFRWLSLESW